MSTVSKICAFLAGVALFILVSAPRADAAVVKLEQDEKGYYIMYVGSVDMYDRYKLMELMQNYPTVKRVKMSSPGGVATEGYEIGKMFRTYQMEVEVPRGAYCLSACATAFSGGINHQINGALGFHVSWTAQHNMPAIQAMIAGQQLATQRARYYMTMGFSYDLPYIIAMGTSPSKFLTFKSTEEFAKFYVGYEDGAWALLLNLEYDEDYFKEHLIESELILDYVVQQRLEDIK